MSGLLFACNISTSKCVIQRGPRSALLTFFESSSFQSAPNFMSNLLGTVSSFSCHSVVQTELRLMGQWYINRCNLDSAPHSTYSWFSSLLFTHFYLKFVPILKCIFFSLLSIQLVSLLLLLFPISCRRVSTLGISWPCHFPFVTILRLDLSFWPSSSQLQNRQWRCGLSLIGLRSHSDLRMRREVSLFGSLQRTKANQCLN